jgi:hypothetical protein
VALAAPTIAELEGDPHPVFARLREERPVCWVPGLDGWLITRRDLVLEAMRDADTFTVDDRASRPGASSGRACSAATAPSIAAIASRSPGRFACSRSASGSPAGSPRRSTG